MLALPDGWLLQNPFVDVTLVAAHADVMVESFRLASEEQGGWSATIVALKTPT